MNQVVHKCKRCEYSTTVLCNYQKHMMTKKHKLNFQNRNQTPEEKGNNVTTCYCGRKYKSRSGLWNHKQSCLQKCPQIQPMTITVNIYTYPSLESLESVLNPNYEKQSNEKFVEPVAAKLVVSEINKGLRCNEPECNKLALGKTEKCASHGGGFRCNEPECNKIAQGNTDNCIAHGGGYRCTELGCASSARRKFGKCKSHGGGYRCVEFGCTRSAQGKTGKCASHGGGHRCIQSGCTSSAMDKTGKCASHGGGIRCPNCVDWIDSRAGTSKYDGYCITCFKRIFPEDPRSKVIHSHNKEMMVRNTINANFDGFVHNRPLYTGGCDCTHRRRIDHRKLINSTILAIETDEFGHRGYNQKDEEIRYDDVYMIHSGKWIFIRFNPDDNVSKVDISDKLEKLVETIEDCIVRIENDCNTELVEIIKLYC